MIIWKEKEIKIRHHLKRLFKFLYTLTYFIWLIPLRLYDILHGTEYGGIDKTGDKDGRFAYFPSPVISFLFLRRYVRRHIQKGRGHSVLDIGCGKGIVLLFFSRMAFDRVSGIEYDEKLCRMAEKNLKKSHRSVNVYQADAAEFSGYKNYDTFYLYNPFDETILGKCFDRILLSLPDNPRKLTVFYCNPVYGDILKRKGFQEEGHFYYKTTVYVYEGEFQEICGILPERDFKVHINDR